MDIAGVDSILKGQFLQPILDQLHSPSPLLEAISRPSDLDWGFEEIWPSTRAVDQEWFNKWEIEAGVRPLSQRTLRAPGQFIGKELIIPIYGGDPHFRGE